MPAPLCNAVLLQGEYVAAQRLLLAKLESAERGERPWPRAEEYGAVARLGKLASAELQRHLQELKNNRRESRIGRIRRMSASERRWQPSPELWLSRQQDFMGDAREETR